MIVLGNKMYSVEEVVEKWEGIMAEYPETAPERQKIKIQIEELRRKRG
jgi:hypothetical protein